MAYIVHMLPGYYLLIIYALPVLILLSSSSTFQLPFYKCPLLYVVPLFYPLALYFPFCSLVLCCPSSFYALSHIHTGVLFG